MPRVPKDYVNMKIFGFNQYVNKGMLLGCVGNCPHVALPLVWAIYYLFFYMMYPTLAQMVLHRVGLVIQINQ